MSLCSKNHRKCIITLSNTPFAVKQQFSEVKLTPSNHQVDGSSPRKVRGKHHLLMNKSQKEGVHLSLSSWQDPVTLSLGFTVAPMLNRSAQLRQYMYPEITVEVQPPFRAVTCAQRKTVLEPQDGVCGSRQACKIMSLGKESESMPQSTVHEISFKQSF
jgi:hypothetical protein